MSRCCQVYDAEALAVFHSQLYQVFGVSLGSALTPSDRVGISPVHHKGVLKEPMITAVPYYVL